MFNGTLKVGKEYELNNGGVCECVLGTTPNPVLNGVMYSNDGSVWRSGPDHPLSVRGPAVGTLEELDVKPGDVVKYHSGKAVYMTIGKEYTVLDNLGVYMDHGEWWGGNTGGHAFRIISRAEHTAKTPTLFRDMTDAEQCALLLAWQKGKEIEYFSPAFRKWVRVGNPSWLSETAYRIKPEPVTETVTLYMGADLKNALKYGSDNDAYKLHFDVIDGKPCNPRFEAIE